MPSTRESRRAARRRRRAERKAARARRSAGRVDPRLTASPDDAAGKPVPMPVEAIRRTRTFELIEGCRAELVASREAVVLALHGAGPGTDAHAELTRQVEALDEELDDLREQADELLEQLSPLALPDDRLGELEQTLTTARALAEASQRATALLDAAQQVLEAVDGALDEHNA